MPSNLYSQGFGTTSTASLPGNAVVSDRSPASTDIKGELGLFPVGQLWVNSLDESGWQLMAFDSDNGVVSAHWAVLGGSTSDVNTLSGDTGLATPTGGDIKIAGGAGITTSASGSTVTVSLTGGDIAIDQVTVDASTAPGTNPVKAASDGGITVTGAQVAAGTTTNVIRTDSLAANTYTIEVQRSAATASSTVGSNGVSHFNSNHFTVDSNGFVGLSGGGQAVDSLAVDANTAPGTNPVVPTSAGLITITGGQIAAATTANAVRTASLAANTYTVQVQRSKAEAVSTVGSNGLAHFNSAQFTVDSNGYVELAGGGLAIDSVAVQYGTTPIVPDAAGLITINGASIAAGTNPVRTHGTGANTMAVEVQIAQAIAATDATKIGLCNFDSTHFSVDANGFVQLLGGGEAIDSFIPDSGTSPVVPAANGSVTMSGSGSITTVGGTNTLTTQLTGLTNHSVLVGAGTTTITKVAPSATSGVPFISQGAASDPTFGTAVVAGGGTGGTSFTSYGLIAAGTTTTGAFQTVTPGSANTVVISGGTGALHSYTSAFKIASDVMTNTSQPAFLAYLNSDTANVTGDGTVWTYTFDVEVFDQGSVFASNTLTAPTTGRYQLSSDCFFGNIGAAHTSGSLQCVTSNRTYRFGQSNCAACSVTLTNMSYSGSILADMDTSDTAKITLTVSNGTKVITAGGTSALSAFSGVLIC